MISIFPSELPVGQFYGSTQYASRIMREKLLASWQEYRGRSALDSFVVSGFTLSAGTGLAVNIAAGDCIINGFWVNSDSTLALGSLSANRGLGQNSWNPNFIWLQLDRDSDGLVTGAHAVANITGTPPTDSVLLGVVATGASTVSSHSEVQLSPTIHSGSYSAAGGDGVDDFIYVGFVPKLVHVLGPTHEVSGAPNPDAYGLTISPTSSGRGFTTGASGASQITSTARMLPLISGYGFIVKYDDLGGSGKFGLNLPGETYDWIAWA